MTHRPRAEFTDDELRAVLSRYDLGAVHSVEPLRKGSRRSPKVLVHAEGGTFVLKRRAPGRDDPRKVAFSHAVQRYLAASDFPLPHLQATRDTGDSAPSLHGAVYEMFAFLPGGEYEPSVGAAEDAGRLLARFHTLLAAFRTEWDPSHHGYHDNNGVRTSLNGIPASVTKHDSVVGREAELLTTIAVLFDSYDRAAERVDALGYREWPSQIVHADWHPGNMLFLDGQVSGVIDYDSLRWLPPVTDVANGALQFSIIGGDDNPAEWPDAPDLDRLQAFLRGYQSVRPLADGPRAAIPFLMIEALIAEAVLPVAATGYFGRFEGFRFLQMVRRKADWLAAHPREAADAP